MNPFQEAHNHSLHLLLPNLHSKLTMPVKKKVPFPDESDIDKLSRSNKARFSGLSLISSPKVKIHLKMCQFNNYKFQPISSTCSFFPPIPINFLSKQTVKGKVRGRSRRKDQHLQKASTGDWEVLRLTLTITGFSSMVLSGAEELSPMDAMHAMHGLSSVVLGLEFVRQSVRI